MSSKTAQRGRRNGSRQNNSDAAQAGESAESQPRADGTSDAAVREVQISVPLSTAPPRGYVQRDVHVELRARDQQQAEALRKLRDGLDAQGARLSTGQPVYSMADTVRWLAERLAEQL